MFDMIAHLTRQAAFSRATFGPGARTKGVIDHVKKELAEVVIDVVTPFQTTVRGYLDDPANRDLARAEEARFAALWPDELAADPLYNPNLALAGTAYALAWPPRVAGIA